MSIHILYQFKEGPYGGANQFLKALKNKLSANNLYEDDLLKAKVVLANANPSSIPYLTRKLYRYKEHKPEGIVVVRIDGPISRVRGKDVAVDHITNQLIHTFADGVIYQSEWSREENVKLFGNQAPHQTIIHNATDPTIFYPRSASLKEDNKISIIATSWSSNERKGFDVYSYLDQHLDFSRFHMTFIGNTPTPFKNIQVYPPMASRELAKILRTQDVYLTASQNDPCSNSLLEALACGLPAVVRNSGGHPELVRKGGITFKNTKDVLEAIKLASQNLPQLKNSLPNYLLADTVTEYLNFMNTIRREIAISAYQSKHLTSQRKIGAQIIRLRYAAWLGFKMLTPYEQVRQRPTKHKAVV